ncbi:MAG: ABC transporter substrate-binding protein [Lachnospiraceae bacterium]|nr:ABC transporter substrate-binding protein [Lachnospiraceae bacterium]
MKRRLAQVAAVVLCVGMVGTLAACGNSSSDSSGGDTAAADEEDLEPVTEEETADQEAAAAEEEDEGEASQAAASSGDMITVGMVYPATGALAGYGQGTEEMYSYAIDQINEQGGIEVDGEMKQLEIVFADSESDATKASEAANNLISSKGVQIMLTAKTADTTVPVAAACERAGIVCLSDDTPDEAWATSDYQYAFHAGFDTEHEMMCFSAMWDTATNGEGGTVAVMHATDTEGQTLSTAFLDYIPTLDGYEAYDPGAYTSGATDYTSIINNIKSEDCAIITGVMLTSDFGTFFSQLKSSGYMPKATLIGKATLFKSDVEACGADGLADKLCSEIWWTPDYPYNSSITGQTSQEIADAWIEVVPGFDYAPPTAGYDYANVEILYNVLKEAGTLDSDAIAECCETITFDTCIGPIDYNESHYSVQPIVTGQWHYEGNAEWSQTVIDTSQVEGLEPNGEFESY